MKKNYVVGIDVGSFSVGMAAIEVDEQGMPIEILSILSHIHDSGIDPDENKRAITRLAASGVARRTRRLYRRKRRRLIALDAFLEQQGWGTESFESYEDPFYPWRVRAELATKKIEDEAELGEKLSIALRHIARHRGWRNPYLKVSSLYVKQEPSAAFEEIRELISSRIGQPLSSSLTVGQLVDAGFRGNNRLRGEGGLLSARLQQSDHAREILEIAELQGISPELTRKIIDFVFAAESPKGSASGRVGKDPLQPGLPRALKASDAFQRYRIAALLGNLRIREGSNRRRLTKEETSLLFDHLVNLKQNTEPTWLKLAEILGIDRGNLLGTATMTDDGERAGAKPPVHDTNRRILGSKIKPLEQWWLEANLEERAAMIKAMSNAEIADFDSQAGAKVQAFFADLPDELHEKLDNLHLPIGRAAYSENTLERITNRMLQDGVDLYEARRAEFGIPNDWTPPAAPLNEPVGNPAVDRTLKAVARWLEGVHREWGAPLAVNIEHVRSAFMSESASRELDRDMQRRSARNQQLFKEMQEKLGGNRNMKRADLWRYQSIQRQNGQCAYCGNPIDFSNAEMDHIVPRAGQGSTNKRENLVAVCHRCNLSKSNIPFARWAETANIPGVSVKEAVARTRHWNPDPGMKTAQFKKFTSEVVARFERVSIDEEIDARSIESVAWMANEVRARIHQRFGPDGTKVNVYKGSLTAQARGASGISKRIQFVDGAGKSRLDRRHHAVDAAVVAFLSRYVAETLEQRNSLKFEQELRRVAPQWKEFTGQDAAHQMEWAKWMKKMHALVDLLSKHLDEDRIPVTGNLRLRLGNGRVHEETLGKLKKLKVGDPISAIDIDRASSEALWCALTRHPDFDPKEGLPADPNRQIRVHGTTLQAEDTIEVFPVGAGALKVRGGYVELGASFHHARIYRVPSGKKTAYAMLRVYTTDLVKHRNADLFNVELLPQSMTVRKAEPKLRKALAEGTAEYLGWLVIDDELLVDMEPFNAGQVHEMQQEFGPVTRWKVDGFFNNLQLRLRPRLLSKEGLNEERSEGSHKVIDRPGWLPAVNKLFEFGKVTVVRRDALGRVRISSDAHLPTTWQVR